MNKEKCSAIFRKRFPKFLASFLFEKYTVQGLPPEYLLDIILEKGLERKLLYIYYQEGGKELANTAVNGLSNNQILYIRLMFSSYMAIFNKL